MTQEFNNSDFWYYQVTEALTHRVLTIVMVRAGAIHDFAAGSRGKSWMPMFAGMTDCKAP